MEWCKQYKKGVLLFLFLTNYKSNLVTWGVNQDKVGKVGHIARSCKVVTLRARYLGPNLHWVIIGYVNCQFYND